MGRGTLFSVSRSFWGGEEGKRKKEKKKVKKITEERRKDRKKPVGAEESPGSACSGPFRGKSVRSFCPFFTREESGKEEEVRVQGTGRSMSCGL